MTPDQFMADTTKLLEIQRETGKTIKNIRVIVAFHPEGRTDVRMSWDEPKAPKRPKGQGTR